MNTERLDPRAIKKVSGPAWEALRERFDQINDVLLGVSEQATGELTTIYVKYSAPETDGQPFGVLWLKRSSELTLGLSLPDEIEHPRLGSAPKGCKYAGLTAFIVVTLDQPVPGELKEWALAAFENRQNDCGRTGEAGS